MHFSAGMSQPYFNVGESDRNNCHMASASLRRLLRLEFWGLWKKALSGMTLEKCVITRLHQT